MSTLITDAAVIAALLVIAVVTYVVWDRRRYRGEGRGDFRPTGEVFRDPSTGKLTRVWEDPATGSRQYRDEPER
ncbi:MAG: hypothetical protein J2P38_01650 [Candidatus Dormibacteraeota bacterium]|nr:hypothetical protein [Candidatus Dormibacteraeota bacterium]